MYIDKVNVAFDNYSVNVKYKTNAFLGNTKLQRNGIQNEARYKSIRPQTQRKYFTVKSLLKKDKFQIFNSKYTIKKSYMETDYTLYKRCI